jgi:hypothetical protein
MLRLPEYLDAFYAGEEVTLPVKYPDHMSSMVLSRSEGDGRLTESAITTKLGEIARHWQLIEHSGYEFEVCGLNAALSGDSTPGAMIHVAGIHSSISHDPGNAYEFALQAALYPNVPQIYVAALGSGRSAGLSRKERQHVRRTGRLIRPQGGRDRALPTIVALHEALTDRGVNISRISTDSSGGKLGMALAVELEPGQLTHACYNAMPNICDMPALRLLTGILYEGLWNARVYTDHSMDPWKASPERIDMTERVLAEYYRRIKEERDIAKELRQGAHVYGMAGKSVGLGPQSGNPLLHDTLAVLARHPNAALTYVCASADPLCPEVKLLPNLQAFLDDTALQQSDIRAVVVPELSHAFNAYFPILYQAFKRVALGL